MTPPPGSDRQRLVSDRGPRSSQGSQNGEDRVTGVVSHLAVGFSLIGLAFAAFGFLYPRDLQRDPEASARENELADAAYMRLSTALDAVIITGMVLIGLGGLILAAIFTTSVVCHQCQTRTSPSKPQSQEMTSYRTMATTSPSVGPQPVTSLFPPPTLSSSHRTTAGLDYGTVLSALH